jgi:hypothetical protein
LQVFGFYELVRAEIRFHGYGHGKSSKVVERFAGWMNHQRAAGQQKADVIDMSDVIDGISMEDLGDLDSELKSRVFFHEVVFKLVIKATRTAMTAMTAIEWNMEKILVPGGFIWR